MLQTVRTPVGAFCSKEWSRIPYALDEHRFMQKWQSAVLRQRAITAFLAFSSHILHRGDGAAAVQAEWADGDLLGRSFNGHGRPRFSSVVPREKVLWVPGMAIGDRLSLAKPPHISARVPDGKQGPRRVKRREAELLITLSRRAAPPVLEDRQHVAADASPAFALQMIWKTPGKLPRASSTETEPRESRPSLRVVSVN